MSASIVAIGDELLAGFTLDTNSHWLAERLRLLGFPLLRMSTVRDRESEIVAALRRDIEEPEISEIFCCGGLGPTPDDRTFAAVAVALERELVIEESVRARIENGVIRMYEAGLLDSAELTEGNLRMARIPAGPSEVFRNRRGMAPALLYELEGTRLFVLPGVPLELKGVFAEEIEPRHLAGRTASVVRELRFQFAVEARFYPVLRELEQSHPRVSVGSYPNFETKELVIRCLGQDEKEVAEAAAVVARRMA